MRQASAHGTCAFRSSHTAVYIDLCEIGLISRVMRSELDDPIHQALAVCRRKTIAIDDRPHLPGAFGR
jgi:hypothetical protein